MIRTRVTLAALLIAAVSAVAVAQAPSPPARIRLTVQYKGGEKKVLVREKAVIVSFTPTERSALKPGAKVFAVTQRQPDGSLTAARVNVGLNGQVPPM